MKLYYTPKSHFSRKVRILMGGLGLEAELTNVGDVSSQDAQAFGLNPLMKVPTLHHEDIQVFDSDHIAQYLVRHFDPEDRFQVMTANPDLMNARAVMNGIMAAEVDLILSQRTGMDVEQYLRFSKIKYVMENGLEWLEARADWFSGAPTYADFHLVAMIDHLNLYRILPLHCRSLLLRVREISKLDYVSATKPPKD